MQTLITSFYRKASKDMLQMPLNFSEFNAFDNLCKKAQYSNANQRFGLNTGPLSPEANDKE